MEKIERLLPKISLSKFYGKNIKDYNCSNNKFIMNGNERCLSLNNNLNRDIFKYFLSKDVKKERKKKYHIKNEVFEDVYDNKENELLMLMNDLSQKIKEYDDILYTKYRSDYKNIKNNRELLVFEKNIIDFKNCQIQYIKKLINYLKERNNLKEFYLELKKINSNKKRFSQNKKEEQKNLNFITRDNQIESRNKNEIFPLFINNSDNEPYLTISKKERININENENGKEQIDEKLFLIDEEQRKTKLFERNMNDKIQFQEMKKNKTIDEEKYSRFRNKYQVKNKGLTKAKTIRSEMSVLGKQKYTTNMNTLKYLDNENKIKNKIKNNEIYKDNEENYKYDNITNKNNNNFEGNDINNDNKYHKNYLSSHHIKNGRLNLSNQSVNDDNKKLYNSLDINEPNLIGNESNIVSLNHRSLENESGSNEKILDLGDKEEKRINKRNMKKYSFRKLYKRNKKLGFNLFDFLI